MMTRLRRIVSALMAALGILAIGIMFTLDAIARALFGSEET